MKISKKYMSLTSVSLNLLVYLLLLQQEEKEIEIKAEFQKIDFVQNFDLIVLPSISLRLITWNLSYSLAIQAEILLDAVKSRVGCVSCTKCAL